MDALGPGVRHRWRVWWRGPSHPVPDSFIEEADSSEEVGVRVQVGKRRKVARKGKV